MKVFQVLRVLILGLSHNMCGNDLLGGGLHSLCAFLIKFLLNNIIYCCFFFLFVCFRKMTWKTEKLYWI